jgi:4-hydroxy-tetrahydrodipicolinate reductase
MLCKLGDANPEIEIVAKCDIADGFDKTWPADTDAVIDFTFHSAVPANIAKAVETNSAFVLGTTGLTAEEEKAVVEASAKIPVVKSANMSLGVNLLLELVRKAASVLGNDYDIEVVEMHHRLKKGAL